MLGGGGDEYLGRGLQLLLIGIKVQAGYLTLFNLRAASVLSSCYKTSLEQFIRK